MTDADLVRKKLAFLATCVAELRSMARLDRLESDVREERFVVHTLQLAIQAALDVAFHIVSDEGLGEPRSNRDAFDRLARHGVVRAELATALEKMAGFRNVVVYGYEVLDLSVVREVVEHRLDDLLTFATDVDRWLDSIGAPDDA